MMPGDVFRVGMPRSDLKVTVAGVPVQAGFALGSYAAFKSMDDGGAMVMGDLVLLDEEVPTVQMATGLHAALGASKTPLGPTPPATPPAAQLDAAALQSIIGHTGRVTNGVLSISVPRAETVTENGMELLPAMGVATALNFQPTDGARAAITGDFVLTGNEVNPVASSLRAAGVEVTAIHNHALGDEPRLFYMHFWANDDPVKLATALRAALDLTNSAPPMAAAATK